MMCVQYTKWFAFGKIAYFPTNAAQIAIRPNPASWRLHLNRQHVFEARVKGLEWFRVLSLESYLLGGPPTQ